MAETSHRRRQLLATPAVEVVEEALSTIVRQASLPRLHERLIAEAGYRIDRATLQALRRIDDRIARLTDLSEVLGLDISTVSRTVKRLEGLGLVTRHSMTSDGRASVLRVTAEGQTVLDRLKAVRRRQLGDVLADWTQEDQETLAVLLGRLADDVMSEEGGLR